MYVCMHIYIYTHTVHGEAEAVGLRDVPRKHRRPRARLGRALFITIIIIIIISSSSSSSSVLLTTATITTIIINVIVIIEPLAESPAEPSRTFATVPRLCPS